MVDWDVHTERRMFPFCRLAFRRLYSLTSAALVHLMRCFPALEILSLREFHGATDGVLAALRDSQIALKDLVSSQFLH